MGVGVTVGGESHINYLSGIPSEHTSGKHQHKYLQHNSIKSLTWFLHMCLMRWLRLVGSLKLYVSFAKYRLLYRALLQKRPMILRSLLIVATPYLHLTHSYPCHNSFIHTNTCYTTPSEVWHNSFIFLYMYPTCDLTHSYPYHNSSIHTNTCDTTPLEVWNDSFIYILHATWRIYTRAITHPYTWHDSSIHKTWLIHTHDMTHLCMWSHVFIHACNDSLTNATWQTGTYFDPMPQWVMSRVWMREWVMSRVWMREWVMSRVWMREWVMSRVWMREWVMSRVW